MPKRLNFPGPNKEVVELEETNFFFKIETLLQPKHARGFFLLKDSEEECDVPEEIKYNFQNIREACETNSEALKKIAVMWNTSSENPKNGSG
ncbi:30156_t:CDS:2, partial [Racocetra persica]